MIPALKSDEIIKKVGGRFRLTALVQRRMKELIDGSRPLVETEGKNIVEIVIEEIMQDKIAIDHEKSESLNPLDTDGILTDEPENPAMIN